MKHYYLIEKRRARAWGLNPWVPHEVFKTKKSATERCRELNRKAKSNIYEVTKVLNGDFTEFFDDGH